MPNIEKNELNTTVGLDFKIFGSIVHNFDLKFHLFWIRAKNTPQNGRYFKRKKNILPHEAPLLFLRQMN